jgi:hypothetical protein
LPAETDDLAIIEPATAFDHEMRGEIQQAAIAHTEDKNLRQATEIVADRVGERRAVRVANDIDD